MTQRLKRRCACVYVSTQMQVLYRRCTRGLARLLRRPMRLRQALCDGPAACPLAWSSQCPQCKTLRLLVSRPTPLTCSGCM